MKVMTFNIQHGLAYEKGIIDLPFFAHFITDNGADICGLNEVRGDGDEPGYTDQMGALAAGTDYQAYFANAFRLVRETPYGNGLLSRYPLLQAETVLIPSSSEAKASPRYEQRCILRAHIAPNGKKLCVLVCHMGLSDAERQDAVAALCEILDALTEPVILMGDFNATPDDPVLRPLFERMENTDALAALPGQYTFASYAPQCKIDYILYRGLVCRSVTTVEKVVSDHFPIIADFVWG